MELANFRLSERSCFKNKVELKRGKHTVPALAENGELVNCDPFSILGLCHYLPGKAMCVFPGK